MAGRRGYRTGLGPWGSLDGWESGQKGAAGSGALAAVSSTLGSRR